MTKNQRKAAMDAIIGILGQPPIDEPTGPQNGPQVPQAFADAWNKIIETYDNENVTVAELQELLEKIQTGKLTILEAVGKVDLTNPWAKCVNCSWQLQNLFTSFMTKPPVFSFVVARPSAV